MKRFCWLVTLVALVLTACSSESSGAECREGVCISVRLEGPVKALDPALVVVTLTTDQDIADLYIGIRGDSTVTIHDSVGAPAGAAIILQDETYLTWQFSTIAGQEYTFSGHVIFARLDAIASYGVEAVASKPAIARVTDYIGIYLDGAGNQMDAAEARSYLELTVFAPTAPADLTIVPFTPFPTLMPLQPTLAASATPPASSEPNVTPATAVMDSTLSPTTPPLAPYPGPESITPTAPAASTEVVTTGTPSADLGL